MKNRKKLEIPNSIIIKGEKFMLTPTDFIVDLIFDRLPSAKTTNLKLLFEQLVQEYNIDVKAIGITVEEILLKLESLNLVTNHNDSESSSWKRKNPLVFLTNRGLLVKGPKSSYLNFIYERYKMEEYLKSKR